MIATRLIDLLPLASLACLLFLGVTRIRMLRARGIQPFAIDRSRSPAQSLTDLVQLICLLLWAYEVFAFTVSLPMPAALPWLGVRLIDALWVKSIGVLALVAGLVLYAWALRSFGDSWRLGIDRERPGPLVMSGSFARSRNPIYVALDLLFAGAFLVQGRLVLLLLALANAGLLHLLILREERFLAKAYGAAYREYCVRVGRYVTCH